MSVLRFVIIVTCLIMVMALYGIGISYKLFALPGFILGMFFGAGVLVLGLVMAFALSRFDR